MRDQKPRRVRRLNEEYTQVVRGGAIRRPQEPLPKKKVPALKLEGIHYGDDIEGWVGVADALCRLKMSAEYARQFSQKASRYLQTEDRSDLALLINSFDRIYAHCWEKLIRKIRGI